MNAKLKDATSTLRNRLVNRALRLADQAAGVPTLAAVRSALIVMLPFMFLGSLAILLNSFPLTAYRDFMAHVFGPRWTLFGEILYSGTFAIMSLSLVFSIGQHLVDQFNSASRIFRANPVIAGLVNLAALFCLFPQSASSDNLRWFGVSGLFVALLVGLASTRLFLFFFSFKQLHLHLRGGAPDIALPRTFSSFLPGILTLLVFAAVGTLLHGTGSSLHELAYHYIRLPFDALHDGLERSLLYILSLHVLWFLGIHGANVLDPITHDIYGAAMLANETAAAVGLPLPHIMTKNFMDVFVFMGGSGAGICLAGALILFGKTRTSRGLGFLSLLPGMFNINEILLFGLPVVLNPLMLIPFVGTPLILAGVSYLAVVWGLVPGASVATEWTTPVLLNGYLATGSLNGSLLQLLNLCLGVCIYAPFVVLTNKVNIRRTNAAFSTLTGRICGGDGGPLQPPAGRCGHPGPQPDSGPGKGEPQRPGPFSGVPAADLCPQRQGGGRGIPAALAASGLRVHSRARDRDPGRGIRADPAHRDLDFRNRLPHAPPLAGRGPDGPDHGGQCFRLAAAGLAAGALYGDNPPLPRAARADERGSDRIQRPGFRLAGKPGSGAPP